MRSIEKSGRTVDEAIREALDALGVERDVVEIEVLEEGSKGLFGILGSRQARVRVTVKEEPAETETQEDSGVFTVAFDAEDEDDAERIQGVDLEEAREAAIERACNFVRGVAERLGLEVGIETREAEDDIVHINMTGDNVGLLIGRHGQTLDAIQYLCNVVANRRSDVRVRVVCDAEGYRVRREATLTSLAERMAERVALQGRKAVLEPMSALERRVVHLALQDNEKVTTYSEGEEPYRRVIIAPKP